MALHDVACHLVSERLDLPGRGQNENSNLFGVQTKNRVDKLPSIDTP
jgi:hypothetical protein